MAIVRAIDDNKKLSEITLTDEEFNRLKSQADAADMTLDDMALILITDGKTSRFKGTVEVLPGPSN